MTSTDKVIKNPKQHYLSRQGVSFEKAESSNFIPKINEKIQRLMCIEDIKIQSVAVIGYN